MALEERVIKGRKRASPRKQRTEERVSDSRQQVRVGGLRVEELVRKLLLQSRYEKAGTLDQVCGPKGRGSH